MTSWQEAFGLFSEHLRSEGRRYVTIKSHVSHLRTLAAAAPSGPATVTADTLEEWLNSSGSSRRNAWVAARLFFGWAARVGVVQRSPVAGAPPRRRPEPGAVASLPGAWREPVESYVTAMHAAGRTVRTIELHLCRLRGIAVVHPEGPWELTTDDLAEWIARHRYWQPETRKSVRGVLRSFYRHAVRRGVLEGSPAEPLEPVAVPRGTPRPATRDALDAALSRATDKQRLMVLLGAYAGLRAAEIAAVRPSTDVEDGFLYIRGKGGHERRIPVHPMLSEAIGAEVDRRRAGSVGSGFHNVSQVTADGYLFPSPGGGHVTPGNVTLVVSRLLPPGVTAHTLRHRFASEAYAVCLDLRAIQELLGHASPVTTARYTAVPPGHLQAAVFGIR